MQFSTSPVSRTPPTLATLVLLSGLSALSMNLYLPSLPFMAVYFQTDYKVMQLSIALYLLVNAALQILIGPIADKMGRRPVLLWGLGLFLLATLGCIYAPNIETFLAFRMCQAVIVVGIVLSRAAVRDMYEQDTAASMIGYVTMGMAVVPMLGPAVGGVFEEAFGWKANFWLPFALAALAWLLTYRDFGETAAASGKTLLQQFREYPELLMSPRFWGYSLSSALCSGAFFAYLGGAPFLGTEVFGMTATEVGVYFGAPALGYFFGNFISGRYSVRFGVNRMVLWGCWLNATGVAISAVLFLVGLGTALSFFGLVTLVGLGNGLSIPNATSGALSVRPHLAATASGLSGAIMLGGGAGLSAWAGALLTRETGAMPLLWLMLATSVLAIFAILSVIWRERKLGL
ncbi:multidrug effflux MFS transporter [Ruegeria sp.]|uniref:multidrug effflux MFS transporter n=1 Tax=Ruegeria sp. TaxID=1879320 RepID=UPI002309025A|nr:multidrug effflux MFS transporter [Ruegeria sp.]MDA7965125.1 multidrug effflux MFS transporter [Ruegeria sp.]